MGAPEARRIVEPGSPGWYPADPPEEPWETPHGKDIHRLRVMAEKMPSKIERLAMELAADLLEAHDATGISLDNWPSARGFVENYIECPIKENGA